MATIDARRLWQSPSPEATQALACALGRELFAGSLVALRGDMGAGKTCFVRGLAQGLDSRGVVASPTYALMAAYAGRLPLYHYDAWMEGREKAFFLEGGDEWLAGDGVAVVEWAERIATYLPRPHLSVELSHRSPSARAIAMWIEGSGPMAERYAALLASLAPVHGSQSDAARECR
jgi:tRNA threonylcarbamoyladenosine biosynthesis protein TsaE